MSRGTPMPTPIPKRQPSTRTPAHLPLHRRLLFPTFPPDKPLPPIVHGQGEEIALLNERIYHLLALLLRAYLLPALSRISPRDRTIPPLVLSSLILPVLRPPLQTLHDDPAALAALLLLDLPTLLALHFATIHSALDAVRSLPPLGAEREDDEREVGRAYHARLPLLSVELVPPRPTSTDNEPGEEKEGGKPGTYALCPLYFTAMADSLLRETLPPEEYAVPVQRLMARELLGRTVLVGVGRRLGEGWFWYGLILKFLGEPRRLPTAPVKAKVGSSLPDLLAHLVLRIWSTLLTLWTLSASFLALLSASPPPPPKFQHALLPTLSLLRTLLLPPDAPTMQRRMVFAALESLVLLTSRFSDRVLYHLVTTRVATPQVALRVTDLLERIVFPDDGWPAPSPPDPTEEEASDMRRRAEERIWEVVPPVARKMLALSKGDVRRWMAGIGNAGCNAHLVGMLLDSAVRTTCPDLAVQSWADALPPDCDDLDGVAADKL